MPERSDAPAVSGIQTTRIGKVPSPPLDQGSTAAMSQGQPSSANPPSNDEIARFVPSGPENISAWPARPPKREVGGAIVLKVVAQNGSIDVTSDSDEISFGLLQDMYTTGDGYGCQVGEESNREAVERLCFKIAAAIKEYRAACP